MEETTATVMEAIITNTGSVVTGLIGWMGDVATGVTGNAIMGVMCVGVPLALLAVGMFRSFTRRRSR